MEKILNREQAEKYPYTVVDNKTGVVTFLQSDLQALEMMGNNHREMTMFNEEEPAMRTRILENGQHVFEAIDGTVKKDKKNRIIVDWYESDGKMHTGYVIGISRDAAVVRTSTGKTKTIEGTQVRGGIQAFSELKANIRDQAVENE